MQLDRYELKAGKSLTTFEFTSEGPNSQIPKLIQFTPTNYGDLYNLAFGDRNADTFHFTDP